MPYRLPSSRKHKKGVKNPNLIPILDAVFIFIFFLLVSANFVRIFEIQSDVPIVSTIEPPKSKKNPLALTVRITEKGVSVLTGVPSRQRRFFSKQEDQHNFEDLRAYLIQVKKRNMDEQTVILEPLTDLPYEELVKVMDAVKNLRNTDETIYIEGPDGVSTRLRSLFPKIIFGNLFS